MVLKNLRLKGYLALPLTPTPPTKRELRHPYPFTWTRQGVGVEMGLGLSVNYGFTLFFMWNCSLFYSNVLIPFLIIYLQDCPPSIRQLWKQMWHIAWSYSQILASTFAIVPQIQTASAKDNTHLANKSRVRILNWTMKSNLIHVKCQCQLKSVLLDTENMVLKHIFFSFLLSYMCKKIFFFVWKVFGQSWTKQAQLINS